MSQTKVQGPFVANTSLGGHKLTETLNVTSNTTFAGANTKITSANVTITSASTKFTGTRSAFSGANVFFSNTTHVNFTGANVVGLPAGSLGLATSF